MTITITSKESGEVLLKTKDMKEVAQFLYSQASKFPKKCKNRKGLEKAASHFARYAQLLGSVSKVE